MGITLIRQGLLALGFVCWGSVVVTGAARTGRGMSNSWEARIQAGGSGRARRARSTAGGSTARMQPSELT